MKHIWQLQEAKNKLSEVVDEAVDHGPQIITRRGVEIAVVVSYTDYNRLSKSRKKLSQFFRESPLPEADLDLERIASWDTRRYS